jgi:predicted DNA-binding helix-hairpin-helix protein
MTFEHGIYLNNLRKATPIEIEKAKKELDIVVDGYKAEFNNKTVSFGCKKDITVEELKAVKIVMNMSKKFEMLFEIGRNTVILEKNAQRSLSIEQIDKLISKLEQ